jgi:hypothetical protein
MRKLTLSLFALFVASHALAAPQLITEDLDRFWSVWDAAGGKPDARALAEGYLGPGTQGLKDFQRLRIGTADALAAMIAAHPAYYAGLRRTTAALPAAKPTIEAALARVREMHPQGELPPVYFVIGAMNSGGTTSDAGLLIGVDMYGKHADTDLAGFNAWHRTVLGGPDLLPAIVVHESIHALQSPELERQATLLDVAIGEGVADLVTEKVFGRHINAAAHAWGRANECTLWQEFSPRMAGAELAGFLYGGQPPDRPADLGYFIGYRIGEAWLARAVARGRSEGSALAALIDAADGRRILEESGYAPCAR